MSNPIPRMPSSAARRGQRQLFDDVKPPYRVPLVSEIRKIPWNGLTVATTFAGCGGSSLGYRMAGFRVVWANEFVPAAQDSYRANMDPRTMLDPRDIKLVTADEILKAIKMKRGELDLFDGSPPCQAFSTAGKRERGWGEEKRYENGVSQKNEDLFGEYIRLLDGLAPRTFVAENVSGLVKGAAKGFFLEILRGLKAAAGGYAVEARLVDAQWLGVPQARQRLIFVGVRADLCLAPAFPVPLPYRYSVRDAIPWIGSVKHDTKGNHKPSGEIADRPSTTITIGHANYTHYEVEDHVVHATGRKGQSARDVTDQPSPTLTAGPSDKHRGGGPRNHFKVETRVMQNKNFKDSVEVTEEPAYTITGKHTRRSAPMVEVRKIANGDVVADNVAPTIEGYALEAEYDKLAPGQSSDKFFNLVRADATKPCPTVSSQSGDGHTAGVIHPHEKRKFTIAELRRIGGFPDDFILTGSFSQQWERVGNSVPPPMARAIAEAVRDRVLLPARAAEKSRRRAPRAGRSRAQERLERIGGAQGAGGSQPRR